MKQMFNFANLLIAPTLLLLITGCQKENFPTVITSDVSTITKTTALSGGNITSEGSGTIIERGVCWSTDLTPDISDSRTKDGAGAGIFSSTVTGLKAGTKYYLRAYASNSDGTGYGMALSFTTVSPLTDVEGNTYNTVDIGTQSWMAENLRTTKFNDNTNIPNVTDKTTWASVSTAGYCWYNNDLTTNKPLYGALYNWYAITSQKLCPTGWHIPSTSDWKTLTDYFGGESVAGGKLKESGTLHWQSPNTGATNEIGFTSLPGGDRLKDGSFILIGQFGTWWTSSVDPFQYLPIIRIMTYSTTGATNGGGDKNAGYSVRCIKN
jgi:uncharacterized protein (TIGR02145 family)